MKPSKAKPFRKVRLKAYMLIHMLQSIHRSHDSWK